MKRGLLLIFSIVSILISCDEEDVGKNTWVNVLKDADVPAIAEDSQGKIWISTRFSGIAIRGSGNLTYLKSNDGLYSDIVRSLYKDKNGRMWIGTQEGLNYFENGAVSKITTNLVGASVATITEDSEDALWFGTYSGISKYDGSSWDHYDESNGINDDFIEKVAIDDNGIVWIATNGGISSFNGTDWENYTSLYNYYSNGLDTEYIPSLMIDSNNDLWAITWGGGVLKFDGSNWITITVKDGLATNFGRAILEGDDGKIFVGTTAGVSIFDGETWVNTNLGSQIRCLFKDSKGVIWAGTKEHGAFKYNQ